MNRKVNIEQMNKKYRMKPEEKDGILMSASELQRIERKRTVLQAQYDQMKIAQLAKQGRHMLIEDHAANFNKVIECEQ